MAKVPEEKVDYRVPAKDITSKYTTKQFSYPEDLLSERGMGNNEYGFNYVMFFINVSDDSKLLKDPIAGATVSDANLSARQRSAIVGRNSDNPQTKEKEQELTKSIIAGSAIGTGVLAAALGTLASIPVAGASVKSGVIAAGALTFTGDKISKFTNPQKRLKTAIALHVPNQLNVRYGVNWQEEDTSLFTYATTGGKEIAEALDTMTKDGINSAFEKFDGSNIAQSIVAANLLNASSGLSASTGLAQNPNKEQIFQGVDFRTFQMDYQFYPRSPEEAQNVLNIIKQFKYHMHPEFKDSNNFIYIYPSEFDIAYYTGSEENKAIHRHSSCVLTDLTENYTPNGMFNTFKNGIPTQINITLTFRELVQLTKDQIAEDF